MTIITANFSYRRSYTPKGRRDEYKTTETFRGECLVDLLDLTDRQAPPAIRIITPKEEGRHLEVIRHDGTNFWRPLLSPAGERMTPEDFQRLSTERVGLQENWEDYPFAMGVGHFTRLKKAQGPWDRPQAESYKAPERVLANKLETQVEARIWRDGDRDERAARIQEKARQVAVIDGELFTMCPEPTWQVKIEPGHSVLSNFQLRRAKPIVDNVRFLFRADNKAMAEKFATAALELVRVAAATPEVEVLRPETLKHDDRIHAARGLKLAAIPEFSETAGRLKSIVALRAYADLREIADAWDGEHPLGANSLFSATRELIDCGTELRIDAMKDGAPVEKSYGYSPDGTQTLKHFMLLDQMLRPGSEHELDDQAALAHGL